MGKPTPLDDGTRELMALHREWVDSVGKTGKQLVSDDIDVAGLDLSGQAREGACSARLLNPE